MKIASKSHHYIKISFNKKRDGVVKLLFFFKCRREISLRAEGTHQYGDSKNIVLPLYYSLFTFSLKN